ncbi:sensor domain-containing diguanylate cyclase [Thiomicrorhabdus sp. Milos-T2]|uniref:sensor domain-containing diguanylate cyclase n=1 Tax=Thiomicrorhabdus sp. Milos-T2 TaxID=90814 RepID=UPI000494513B|nr:sensor domain-containing diguanylate cyclase [Thiomicrorhabdus sp. Milos-T2]
MSLCQSKKKWYFPLGLTLLAIMLGTQNFFKQVELIKSKNQITVDNRADLLRQYMSFMSVSSDSLKLGIESLLNSKNQLSLQTSIAKKLRFYPEYNLYSLDINNASRSTGTLHVLKDIDLKNPEILSEIAASLSMDPILKPLTYNLKLTAWAYYISKNHFLYISPKHSLKDFQFNAEQYTKPFWVQAIPENNPKHRMIISDVYKDGAGKGMMITLSNPIFHNDEFKGIAAIDISTQQMDALLAVDSTIKSSILVDENNIITASIKASEIGSSLGCNKTQDKSAWFSYNSQLIYMTSVINNELYIVHQITKSQLWLEALKKSLFQFSLIMLGLVLSFLSIELYCVSIRNRNLMLIDSLTKLYNRRGFAKLAEKPIAHLRRDKKGYAVLLLDLDFFKTINDQFGHATGDQVLKTLAQILLSNNREESIISRWGGEEFLILLPKANLQSALDVANRIHEKIHQAEVISKQDGNTVIKFTTSIGVALQQPNDGLEDVINHADKALYQAKDKGRDTTYIYQPG